mmetsp:Transcript_2037/g.7287  ORF Transcript_2037/g.7287 Transcript_2037/m.7287 type:complete len:310 (+) Transcript_2037:802-1731(+)
MDPHQERGRGLEVVYELLRQHGNVDVLPRQRVCQLARAFRRGSKARVLRRPQQHASLEEHSEHEVNQRPWVKRERKGLKGEIWDDAPARAQRAHAERPRLHCKQHLRVVACRAGHLVEDVLHGGGERVQEPVRAGVGTVELRKHRLHGADVREAGREADALAGARSRREAGALRQRGRHGVVEREARHVHLGPVPACEHDGVVLDMPLAGILQALLAGDVHSRRQAAHRELRGALEGGSERDNGFEKVGLVARGDPREAAFAGDGHDLGRQAAHHERLGEAPGGAFLCGPPWAHCAAQLKRARGSLLPP